MHIDNSKVNDTEEEYYHEGTKLFTLAVKIFVEGIMTMTRWHKIWKYVKRI